MEMDGFEIVMTNSRSPGLYRHSVHWQTRKDAAVDRECDTGDE
jgi:hypothetical protein